MATTVVANYFMSKQKQKHDIFRKDWFSNLAQGLFRRVLTIQASYTQVLRFICLF